MADFTQSITGVVRTAYVGTLKLDNGDFISAAEWEQSPPAGRTLAAAITQGYSEQGKSTVAGVDFVDVPKAIVAGNESQVSERGFGGYMQVVQLGTSKEFGQLTAKVASDAGNTAASGIESGNEGASVIIEVSGVKGVGAKTAAVLKAAGFNTASQLADADEQHVEAVLTEGGINTKLVKPQSIIAAAKGA